MATTTPPAGALLSERPLWIDLEDPRPDEFSRLAERFGFHPLSIEDALDRRNQRPKIDRFETYRFLVFYEFAGVDSGEAGPVELNAFWGQDYVVTTHHGPSAAVEEAKTRWTAHDIPYERTALALLHTIVDAAVDSALPAIDAISESVEAVEDGVLSGARDGVAPRVQELRRELLALRRVLAPQRDVIAALARDPWVAGSPETSRYFEDVYDHITRASESIDVEREIVTGVMETYLSAVSNSLNEVMKTLTVAATVLMAMSFVAAVYGMNFDNMPELDWRFGYPFALGLMAGAALALVAFFRSRRWL